MGAPCIIRVAITGSVPRKAGSPVVPISIAEQIESPQAAFEAGAAGGHARTGLEDNRRMDRSTPRPSSAALVHRTAVICANHNSPVTTPAQARQILGLRPA